MRLKNDFYEKKENKPELLGRALVYSYGLTASNINNKALDMSTISFAVTRIPKYTQPCKKTKTERGGGSKIERWITNGV